MDSGRVQAMDTDDGVVAMDATVTHREVAHDGWRPLFELFRQWTSDDIARGRPRRGVLTSVSPLTVTCTARFDDGVDDEPAQFPWDRRVECLSGVVEHSTAFRIAVEASAGVVGRACVEVHDERFDAQVRHGPIDGEVYVVGMLASCWRDIVVLPRREAETAARDDDDPCADVSDPDASPAMWQHQTASLAWMEGVEDDAARNDSVRYEGNLRITDEWFVDTEGECFTRDPSWREARMRGGILADWAGSGKTATVLVHCCRRRDGAGAGSLVVVPLNVVGQWMDEAQRFCPRATVLRLSSLADVRALTALEMERADVVVTTFEFLRDSRAYAHLVEEQVCQHVRVDDRRAGRSRAAVCAYSRIVPPEKRTLPIVEAAAWRRIVVDEAHEAMPNPRNAKIVGSLNAAHVWGITATPDLSTVDAMQQHYWLLQREKAHHPNLLHRLVHRCIRYVRPRAPEGPSAARSRLVAVRGAAVEMERIERATLDVTTPLEHVVRLCTLPSSVTDAVDARDADALLAERHERRALLEAQLRDAERCCAASTRASEAAVQTLREQLRDENARIEFVQGRIDALGVEPCSVCLSEPCGVMLHECAHTFCRACVHRVSDAAGGTGTFACPVCRANASRDEARGVVRDGTKLTSIAEFCAQLAEPVIVFVQWKTMVRSLRAVFRGCGLDVYTLEGNSHQRQKALREFAAGTGVLLLNLNDSFAGLHLPHARHVVFSHAIVADADAVRTLEYQAVARCVRNGQTRQVEVHSFVLAGCIEEQLWRSTHNVSAASALDGLGC